MTRHKKIRVVIDLTLAEPIAPQDINAYVSRSLAAYPQGTATYWVHPLDPPHKEQQEGFVAPMFGSAHLTRGQS